MIQSSKTMPLKKYSTSSSILGTHLNPVSPSPSISTSTSPSPPESTREVNFSGIKPQYHNIQSNNTLANHMSSLVDSIEQQQADISVSIIESSGSASDTILKTKASNSNPNSSNQLPNQIKSRLYALFCQIEHEFDLLYAENMRLKSNIPDNHASDTKNQSSNTTTDTRNELNNSETNNVTHVKSSHMQTLSASMSIPSSISSGLTGAISATTPSSLISSTQQQHQSSLMNAITSKSTLFSSKTRINNLSFPKFKPNAREFIMQSIKNTSAQIVNKTSSNMQSKLQTTLSGHTDGIWDVNVVQVPSHLNSNAKLMPNLQSVNLLIGTASADSTARLWYLNHSQQQLNSLQSSPSSAGLAAAGSSIQTTATNGFCVQQYSGHSGSVNSLRFHPKFFTDATNLILTASGDCQAHIWQSVLSPIHDSLESTSDVVLNYSNCYSIATGNSQSNYHELAANIATIRSPIKRFEGHQDTLIAAEWFPDGDLIATGSWDRSANIYNVETGKMLCNLQHDDYLTNVNIHSTQKIILTSSKDCTFKIWDFRDPICTVNVYQGHTRSVNSAIFVNEDKIATSSDDQTLKLWDLRIMRSPIFSINVNSGVNRICTMTTDDTYICLPLDNRDIKVYTLQGERVLRLPRTNRIGHRRLVTSLASCGNLLVSASFDRQINCWSFDSSTSTVKSSKMTSNKENDQLDHQIFSSPTTPVSGNNGLILNGSSPLSIYNTKPQPAMTLTNLTNSGGGSNSSSNNNGNSSNSSRNTLSKFIKI